MRVLVAGATGFIGGAIVGHLLHEGHQVTALVRSVPSVQRFLAAHEDVRNAQAEERLLFVQGDVTRPESLPPAVHSVDAVVQAAQFTGAPVEDPRRGLTYDQVDRAGTVNLLRAIADTSTKPHFLYMSGITVHAEAQQPWNRAKWQAEEAIRQSGLDWTIVRSCWAYGPGDKALNRLLGYSDLLPFVPIFGSGRQRLTPVFIEDVAKLFSLSIDRLAQSRNTLFRLGGPDVITLAGFLKAALGAMGRRRPILPIPVSLGRLQAQVLQHLPGRPLTPDAVDFVAQEGAADSHDSALIRERFPEFAATPLAEGLAGSLRP